MVLQRHSRRSLSTDVTRTQIFRLDTLGVWGKKVDAGPPGPILVGYMDCELVDFGEPCSGERRQVSGLVAGLQMIEEATVGITGAFARSECGSRVIQESRGSFFRGLSNLGKLSANSGPQDGVSQLPRTRRGSLLSKRDRDLRKVDLT